jgi:hypothetical protein
MNYNLYWPMPFAKSARIVIKSNDSLTNIVWNSTHHALQNLAKSRGLDGKPPGPDCKGLYP